MTRKEVNVAMFLAVSCGRPARCDINVFISENIEPLETFCEIQSVFLSPCRCHGKLYGLGRMWFEGF